MNVLILSASTKVWLVKALQTAARERGGKVIAREVDAESAALFVTDRALLIPRSDDPSFGDILEALCRECHIRLLVPTRDRELSDLRPHADRLRALGMAVLLPPADVLPICHDKRRFSEFCEKQGLAVAKVYRADQFPDCLDIHAPKPHPAGYHAALQLCNAKVEQAIVIGDNPNHDMAAAKAIGARSIRVRTGRFAKEPSNFSFKPTREIANRSKLEDALTFLTN
jgi:beta-phosphoglucomutase-like phosphatase (HAD superfamily)